jgi:hypothetical protein
MKKFFAAFLLLFFALGLTSYSQDILYKKDGSKEEVKVLEINTYEITYKKASNPDGPAYVINRGEVVLISFANGEHELITPVTEEKGGETEATVVREKPFTKDYTRNIMSFHMFDVVFGDIAFSYERILADGRLGIKIPFSFGFYGINPDDTPFDFNNLFYSGFGLNFYPTGQGRVRYFLGPNFRLGVGRASDYYYYYDEWGNYVYDEYYEYNSFYMKYFIDNGVTFMATRNLSISAILSVGLRYVADPGDYVNHIQPDGQFAINLGLRF